MKSDPNEPWVTSVYKAQCESFSVAKELYGATSVSRVDMSQPIPNDAITRFRALPEFRSDAAKDLRNRVAHILWQRRKA